MPEMVALKVIGCSATGTILAEHKRTLGHMSKSELKSLVELLTLAGAGAFSIDALIARRSGTREAARVGNLETRRAS